MRLLVLKALLSIIAIALAFAFYFVVGSILP